MKKNKKILMIGTTITSIVAPVATVISCGSRNTNHNVNHSAIYNTPNGSHGTFHTSIVNNYIVLNIKNYKQYTTYIYNTKTLTIKEGITEISNIFKNGYIPDPSKPNDTVPINSLTLPSTLKKIDDDAFQNAQLTDLTILDNVTTIGNFAFASSPLKELSIPDSVTTIGDSAFLNSKLTSLTIPDQLKNIGNFAFLNAPLTTLVIPNNVVTIGVSAFWNSKLTSLTFGTSLKTIGDWAFINAQLTTLTFPNSITSIGNSAFQDDDKLTTLTIPDSVTNIGLEAFGTIINNTNTRVTMPRTFNNNSDKDRIFGINNWDQIIFTYTPHQSIVLNLSNYKQYTTYIYNTKTLTIKDGITEISDIFKNGYIPDPSKPNDTVPINSLTLPSTLEKIDNNAFQSAQLTDLTIPNRVTTIGDWAFHNSRLTNLTLSTSLQIIGDAAFFASWLTDLTIPNNVTSIGNLAFSTSTLKTLIIPYGVTTIGEYAFGSATLTSLLIIPNSVTSIGTKAFDCITNNSNTHVIIPERFNSDSDKDKIFGAGHWNQITFYWI